MVYTVITIIIVLASILLIGIVLIQNSKGGGLASSFQAQNQIMGVRKTTDFIEKATWVLIIVVVFLSIVSVKFSHNENTGDESHVKEQVEDILPSSTTTNQE
ncbi:MAG: preprotein translocase subunit SecG [Paludibacteraceae bacterium]|nr:preprotein translocase subunit SecG [Paludibacteraceae bacterium]